MNTAVDSLRIKFDGYAYVPLFLSRRIENFYLGRMVDSWGGRHILRGRLPNDNSIVLVSNDYLNLASHPYVLREQARSLLTDGSGILMSAIFLHGPNLQSDVEREYAARFYSEAAIFCQSGWAANVGLIQSIASEKTPVYLDFLAHMSLWEGAISAGSQTFAFRHNDAGSLRKLIDRHGPGVVAIDSVYSTNGSICRLDELVDIARHSGCVIVVDESHAIGTHGPKGAGLVVEAGLCDQVHFRTASLAKAFAGRGGVIFCPDKFKDYFAFTSRPAIFSSALLPHELVGFRAILKTVSEADDRRNRLHYNAAYLRKGLLELGYNVSDSESQIIALEAGPESQTMILRDALEARGVFGSVFCDPATPKNRSLVRLSVHSELTQDQLDHILRVCHDIRDEVDLANWPSTRRMRRREK